MKMIRIMGAVAAIAMAVSWAGCGSGSSSGGGDGDGMSESQAVAFSEQLSGVTTNAMNNIDYNAQVIHGFEAEALKGVSCSPDGSTCQFNVPISWRQNCTAGGRIEVTGSLTGSTSNGSGILQINAQETITDWQCIGDYIINGDPYISLSGQFTFLGGQPSTQQSIGINGGFKWGTTAEESCQIHLTINFNDNGSGTITGTVCGYTVNASF